LSTNPNTNSNTGRIWAAYGGVWGKGGDILVSEDTAEGGSYKGCREVPVDKN